MSASVVVIGAGVGGLCAAIRLRSRGHDVVVVERNAVSGGKLARHERDGFSFDTGPSLLTWPEEFDAVLALAGTTLREQCEVVALDPQFHYRWSDGTQLQLPRGREAARDAIEAFSPGSGVQWDRFTRRSERIWEVSERTFLNGPMGSPLTLAARMRSPKDLLAIDPFPTLARRAAKDFTDPRLRQWLGRYATYSGSSPFLAPATLACIPALEQLHGAWHLTGGVTRLAEVLVNTAISLGVQIRVGSEVESILASSTSVSGVRLADGETIRAEIVVANVDAGHLYRDLLRDEPAAAKAGRATRSSSGFVLLIGVDGLTPGLGHHNIAFNDDYEREFRQLFVDARPADDPTVYVCNSAATDPTQAPAGCENWFVLVNAPSGDDLDWSQLAGPVRERLLDTMARHGWDVRSRARFIETITPADIAQRYRSPGGSIYGTSSNGRRAAFLRPGNRGPRRGLYLVGGSSHPGGGLPMVARSARIVADLIDGDRW
ncbi:MAG: phytoene desaturase family protein [Acidimicrobiia bacterium]